jgi:archaetidylinositol phosphate synthase
LLTKLKARIQQLLSNEARLAHRLDLTPNTLSYLGMVFALLSAIAYWRSSSSTPLLVIAALLLLLSGFCDALDGVLARLYGEVTVFGGFIDSLLDRYADAIVLGGIILGGFSDVSWGTATIIGTLLVSYARARAEAAGVKMESIGLAERPERIIVLAFASLLTLAWFPALKWSVILLAVLTNFTVLQRVIYFYRSLKKKL